MPNRSHEKWTQEEENLLIEQFNDGIYPSEIADELERSELAIRARLAKVELLPEITAEDLEHFRRLRKSELVARNKEEPLDVQQAFHHFYFVYSIINQRCEVYIGSSHNVWHRVKQHNNNAGAKSTRNNGPWYPFSIYCCSAEKDARAMESNIHKNFNEFYKQHETSIKQVLLQIGIEPSSKNIKLLR